MRTDIIYSFDQTVKSFGKKIAVSHNDMTITFELLQRKALSLANSIISVVGEGTNRPIAVFLPKELDTVISDIAILYSANAFMNLDVKTPKERIDHILERIEPYAIITNEKYVSLFDGGTIPIINVNQISTETSRDVIDARLNTIIDTDPMCLINTSGSTGTPKGVVLSHRSFFDFMDWSEEQFAFNGSEILGSLSPVVFDIFDFELCMMMMYGSRLVLIDAGLAIFPVRLLEMLQQNNVSFIFWVPSIMVNIANMELLSKIDLSCLKLVWFAGEVFPTKQFLYWYDHLQGVKFVNLYGPIEITLDCTYHIVESRPNENEPLPIGVPCRNTDILILNDNDELCSAGEEGELCVRGSSLALGYYNNPEKTALAFTQNPLNQSYPELIYRTGDIVQLDENSLIHFKGRKDSLIKHMGYRIELGEIEHIICNELKMVEYCCAVYNHQAKEITLFYEKCDKIEPATFRKALSRIVPNYMIPGRYERCDLLPRNTNGKIDRLSLNNKVNGDIR